MTLSDMERRALIEYHASTLATLTTESREGFGLAKQQRIILTLERMIQLAKELSDV